jgi:hypothetical protein
LEPVLIENRIRKSAASAVSLFRAAGAGILKSRRGLMNIFDLRKLGVAVLAVLLLSPAATGFAQKVTEYTADQVTMGNVKNRKESTLGEETVSGYRCSKKEIEAEIEVMGFKNTSRSAVWQSPKFDPPLRTRSYPGQVTELRNI